MSAVGAPILPGEPYRDTLPAGWRVVIQHLSEGTIRNPWHPLLYSCISTAHSFEPTAQMGRSEPFAPAPPPIQFSKTPAKWMRMSVCLWRRGLAAGGGCERAQHPQGRRRDGAEAGARGGPAREAPALRGAM